MKEIRLTRRFLSNPVNSVFILLGVLLLIELVSWSVAYSIKLKDVEAVGGFLPYVSLIFLAMFLPELITLIITVALVNRAHSWLKFSAVRNDWVSIGKYELKLLPVIASSFWVFNPFTQTIRFLVEAFPQYSFHNYWHYNLVAVGRVEPNDVLSVLPICVI